jgi:hypothetical protein
VEVRERLIGFPSQGMIVEWRWDTSDGPVSLPVTPGHSTVWDQWVALPGAVLSWGVRLAHMRRNPER